MRGLGSEVLVKTPSDAGMDAVFHLRASEGNHAKPFQAARSRRVGGSALRVLLVGPLLVGLVVRGLICLSRCCPYLRA